ncbi:lysophospholipid acyltransferase family protein [Bdellovibrionota bacterium]
MKKAWQKIRSIFLASIILLDLVVTGTVVFFIALFSFDFHKPVYDWAWKWATRGRKILGIRVKIIGEENLQRTEPAIYAISHQSMCEVLIYPTFLPKTIRFLGKKSLKWVPIFGILWMASKQISVDRRHHERAMQAMATARKRIEEGYSLFMAPEGTRSPTGRLGKLKKGIYHLALQTKIPIIPITTVNSYKIQPKHSFTITPGEALIIVDPPIDTTQWKEGEVEERIESLRKVYQSNLNKYGDPEQYAPL